MDVLEEPPTDPEKEDVTALCPWRADTEEVLAQMVAPGPVADTGSGHRWLAGTSYHDNGTE